MSQLLPALCLLSAVFSPVSIVQAAEPPRQAREAGYVVNTFNSDVTKAETDIDKLYRSGKNWYLYNFWGSDVSSRGIVFSSDRPAYVINDGMNRNAQIATGARTQSKNAASFVGTAFGGGAYFEAALAFDPEQVRAGGLQAGWPSFWTLPVEVVLRNGKAQWPDQPQNYEQYAEIDILEYGLIHLGYDTRFYGSNVHHFYGNFRKTCQKGYCNHDLGLKGSLIELPRRVKLTDFHRYGLLWIPATDMHPGYLQRYFDDAPIGERVSWKPLPTDALPPPTGKDWAFSIIDQEHHVLILGSSQTAPLHIKNVSVWQASEQHNIHSND
ncbi:hypothetical protein IVB12_31425 [Bradyrhizobium sp. 179]|uniref:glycoside hydrolase family 16 protein n=1 Tax=Bradyrhizobium sp. 179 TaxID=2782648 RepID=UPI001FF911B4|nr:hypothetical protein [Bradyrhizobium sp. 179]MCK1546330.1 hypothetical protein [Bradyrhizobium sp. 179]